MSLDNVIQRAGIWRGKDLAPSIQGIPSGFANLDTLLPGQGWPRGALTEILAEREGIGALRLLAPALAELSHGDRWLTFVAPPYIPYAPALADLGVELSHLLLVHERDGRDKLWALEQALRSGTCSAVLGWLPRIDTAVLRRLQLAAEAGDALGVLFRSHRMADDASPAALRLQVQAADKGLKVKVLKSRGGWPAGECVLRP